MHPQRLQLVLLAGLALGGCDSEGDSDADGEAGSTGPAEPRALVAAAAWVRVEGAADPFDGQAPPDNECFEAGLGTEVTADGTAFEINTGLCNYATVQQGALNEASAGDELAIRIWHDDLRADEPATGVLAVAVGTEVVWQYEVAIPSTSQLVTETVELPMDIALGDPISVHVHNHGVNTWSILELQVQ